MTQKAKLRLVGGAIILANLAIAGRFDIKGFPLLLMTVGVAVAFELLLVRGADGDK